MRSIEHTFGFHVERGVLAIVSIVRTTYPQKPVDILWIARKSVDNLWKTEKLLAVCAERTN